MLTALLRSTATMAIIEIIRPIDEPKRKSGKATKGKNMTLQLGIISKKINTAMLSPKDMMKIANCWALC